MYAIGVANLMSEATVLHMGRPVINVIISKLFVIPRLQQPRQHPALTGARSHSHHRDVHLLGATVAMAKEVEGITRRRRTPKKPPKQKAYEVTFKNSVLSEVTTISPKDSPIRTK